MGGEGTVRKCEICKEKIDTKKDAGIIRIPKGFKHFIQPGLNLETYRPIWLHRKNCFGLYVKGMQVL